MKKIWKLIFRWCFTLIFCQQVYGSEVVVISYQEESPSIQTIEKILTRDFFIPPSLIKKIKTEFECEMIESAILHLCLTKAEEMKVVDFNWPKVKEVLGVFYEK